MRSAFAPILLIGALGCGGAEGVRSERNPSPPWRVVEDRPLADGDLDSPLHLVRARGFAGTDSTGRIFLYNEAVDRVEIYDETGLLLGTRGRKGGGPGEYQYFGGLEVHPDGEAIVVDQGKGALIRFGPSGAVLPERSYAAIGYAYNGVSIVGDTVVIAQRETDPQGQQPVHLLRWISPGRDTALLTHPIEARPQAVFRCEASTLTMRRPEPLLSSIIVWTAGPETVAAAIGSSYDVAILRSGRLERRLHRPVTPVRATLEHVRRRYPEGQLLFQGRRCRQNAETLADQMGIAPTLPVIDWLRYAPNGDLWVGRFALPADVPTADVFAPDGTFLGTVPGVGFPAGFSTGGRFLGLVPDSLSGAYRLHAYRLEPAPW